VSVCVSARVLSLLTVHFERREREDKGEGTWAPLLICMRYFGYKVFDGKPRGNDGASFIFIYYFQFLRDRERGGVGMIGFFCGR
jgi:hypothetical protein